MRLLFELFLVFAKIGAMTFGGGYAMLPFLQRELVEKRHWVTEEDLLDYYAIGQCTPGVIAVNTATFVGQKMAGVAGGIFATLGMVFPSLVIIVIIAAFLRHFADNPIVKNAFAGIRVCVCVLIANAVRKLWKGSVPNRIALCIYLLVLGLSLFTGVSTILLVLGAGLAGFVIGTVKQRKEERA